MSITIWKHKLDSVVQSETLDEQVSQTLGRRYRALQNTSGLLLHRNPMLQRTQSQLLIGFFI